MAALRHVRSSSDHPLSHVIDELAHLLPAQRPISIFIDHNRLHAFEDQPRELAAGHRLNPRPERR